MSESAADVAVAIVPDQILVSVVVPVHNRSRQLQRLLLALSAQTMRAANLEILICDDGSTEDISAIVDEFRHKIKSPIIHLRQCKQGASAARNCGLAHTRGDIVAFTDSDCEPEPNWLAELTRPFEDPSVGIVGGAIDFQFAERLVGQCANFLMCSTLGAAGARDPRARIHMTYYPRSGNLAVRRELAQKAGGFPEFRHGEDLEFSHRVVQLGVRAEFAPSAMVLHNEARTLTQLCTEAFHKGRARIRLARRLGMHELVHTLPALLCMYFALLSSACIFRPEWLPVCAIPGYLYVAVLALLSLQGICVVRRYRAALLVPLCALVMHWGYGLGYLWGWWDVLASVSCRVFLQSKANRQALRRR